VRGVSAFRSRRWSEGSFSRFRRGREVSARGEETMGVCVIVAVCGSHACGGYPSLPVHRKAETDVTVALRCPRPNNAKRPTTGSVYLPSKKEAATVQHTNRCRPENIETRNEWSTSSVRRRVFSKTESTIASFWSIRVFERTEKANVDAECRINQM
jgi:hypothetical protein